MSRLELPERRETTRVMVVEQVEAWEFGEGDPFVEHRVRLSTEYLDLMSEVKKGLGEMAGVDALSAYVRLAAIREVGDPKGSIRIGG